jgi:hypothetical protein
MPEDQVEGLSGTEIINDVVEQIRRKLQNSCDLRESDCYTQGYSGTAEIKLKLYDMDAVNVEMKIEIPAKVESPVSTEEVEVIPVDIEEKVEIPQELNLEAVRERSKQSEIPPPPEEATGTTIPTRLKRKYTRRNQVEVAAEGGAVDIV